MQSSQSNKLSKEEEIAYQLLSHGLSRIREIDSQIENLLQDKGAAYEFTPPGVSSSRQYGYKQSQKNQLTANQEAIAVSYKAAVEEISRTANADVKEKLNAQIKGFENLKNAEPALSGIHSKSKDINESQEYMNKLAESIADKEQLPSEPKTDRPFSKMLGLSEFPKIAKEIAFGQYKSNQHMLESKDEIEHD